MHYTDNLQLKKPEENEFYHIGDFNHNWDIIDTEIANLKSSVVIDGIEEKGKWKRKTIIITDAEFPYSDGGGTALSGKQFRLLLSDYIEKETEDVVVLSFTSVRRTYAEMWTTKNEIELLRCCKNPNGDFFVQFQDTSTGTISNTVHLVVDILYKLKNE